MGMGIIIDIPKMNSGQRKKIDAIPDQMSNVTFK